MTEATDTSASPLADLVRASRLPEPAERKAIRKRAGVTLQHIADELGVSAQTVWNWENGQDGPSLENAARYAALLAQLAEASR